MKSLAQLVDDLAALKRGEIALDAVTEHLSAHLIRAPHAAEDVLRQIDAALDRQLLEPAQVLHLKTIVADTIAPHNSQLTERIRFELNEDRDGSVVAIRQAARSNVSLGTRLRDRFVLDEVLGAGGMGTVYKGRDLLKIEARDRNPYVAIKVLNDDFRKRDDAFIVLQREASRQQRLAHPNIATVYDFDRTGDTFFFSMELLEGMPLDTFLASDARARSGMSWTEAQRLIDGMGAALTYAHEHGIVHADFKPSNCFLLKDGRVKVLDFGIARAIKRPNQETSDVTVYDGASIGALTPAYASPEMLEGNLDPDPSDDVYGLACVCYEVLSGKHPYNRLSAREARYQKLIPKRIDGLTLRQNRALQRALAFDRAQRTQNVREFIHDLHAGSAEQSFWNRKHIALAVVFLLLIGGAIAWLLIEYPIVRAIADVRSGDPQTVQVAIDRLASMSPANRARIIEATRAQIGAHYEAQVRRLLETGEIDVAYAKAESMLAAGLQMTPSAASLAQLSDEVARRKDRYLSELAEQFETYLAAGRLLRSRDHGDIQGVIQRIRLVDSGHPLLTDPRVPGAFANAAEASIAAGKLDAARAFLVDGLRLAPKHRVLSDVNDKLATAEEQKRLRQRSIELASNIGSQLGANPDLARIVAATPALIELHEIDPGSAVLERTATALRAMLGANYEAIASIATVDEIVSFERLHEPAFEVLGLTEATTRTAARRRALETRLDRLLSDARALAATPHAKWPAGRTLADVIRQVRAIAPGDAQIDAIVTSAIAEQRRESQRLSGAGQWDEARGVLSVALALDHSPNMRAQIEQDIARIDQREKDGIQQSMLAERAAARAAERERIIAAEVQVQGALSSFKATTAGLAVLERRIAALAELDPANALIQSARRAAAKRVAAAANDTANAGEFVAALALLARAAVHLPGAPEIAQAREQVEALQADAARRAQERVILAAHQSFRHLIERPQTTDARWQRDAEAAISAIKKVSPNDAAADSARSQLANAYLASADRLITEKRFTVAKQMVDRAEQLTPSAAAVQTRRGQWARAVERDKSERAVAEAAAKLDATKQRFANELKANQLDRARRTLAELQAMAADDPFVKREAPASLADAYLALGRTRLTAGDLAFAWRHAAAGAALASEDSRFTQLRSDIDAIANRRMEALLSVRGKIDSAAVTALAGNYRASAPDRYEAHRPSWVARVRDQLASLESEPTAHNTYLLAVQDAFKEVAALQSIRPIAAAASVALAQSPSTTNTIANETTANVVSSSAPASLQPATVTTAIDSPATQPAAPSSSAAAPSLEPSLIGKWCSDGLSMTFAASEYVFEFGSGRSVTYPVQRYDRDGSTIILSWTDRNLGAMVMEFGEFSSDGQGMTQLRGKTASAAQWQNYNRKFRKCN